MDANSLKVCLVKCLIINYIRKFEYVVSFFPI